MFSSLRGSAMIAVPSARSRGRSSNRPPPTLDPELWSAGVRAARRAPGRPSARRRRPSRGRTPGVRALGEVRGSVARPSREVRVEGHVVIHELADERDAGRVGRVVGVVQAQLGIGDQQHGPGRKVVLGVEEPAGPPELQHRPIDPAARLRERRQHREQPCEPVLPGGRSLPRRRVDVGLPGHGRPIAAAPAVARKARRLPATDECG